MRAPICEFLSSLFTHVVRSSTSSFRVSLARRPSNGKFSPSYDVLFKLYKSLLVTVASDHSNVVVNVAVVSNVYLDEGARSFIINLHFVLIPHSLDCHRDALGHRNLFCLVGLEGRRGNCFESNFDWGIAAIIDCFCLLLFVFEKLQQRELS